MSDPFSNKEYGTGITVRAGSGRLWIIFGGEYIVDVENPLGRWWSVETTILRVSVVDGMRDWSLTHLHNME